MMVLADWTSEHIHVLFFVFLIVVDAGWLVNGCVFWHVNALLTFGYLLIIPDLDRTTTFERPLIQQPVVGQDGSN